MLRARISHNFAQIGLSIMNGQVDDNVVQENCQTQQNRGGQIVVDTIDVSRMAVGNVPGNLSPLTNTTNLGAGPKIRPPSHPLSLQLNKSQILLTMFLKRVLQLNRGESVKSIPRNLF